MPKPTPRSSPRSRSRQTSRSPTVVSVLSTAVRADAFNVLITAHDVAWETDQRMRLPSDRFREHSPESEFSAAVRLDRPRSLRRLETVPTLLLYESCVGGVTGDVVRVGTLHSLRHVDGELTFCFREDARTTRSVVEEFADRLDLSPWEFNRTHWAIKPGGLPAAFVQRLQPSYDIVLSFAGEQRDYVERVAGCLRRRGVRVFYDAFEEATLWGKDLAEHLDAIYRRAGTYCVIFISEAYREKMWTVHERRAAFARAVESRSEYVLPARFDATELPGVRPSVAYVNLAGRRPSALAKLLLTKLGHA